MSICFVKSFQSFSSYEDQCLCHSVRIRLWVLVMVYAVELAASAWLAYELRFDFAVDPAQQKVRLLVIAWLVPLQLALLGLLHQFTPLLGYFSIPDLARVFHALALSALLVVVAWFVVGAQFAPPRGVIAIDFILALVGLTGVRLVLRTMRELRTDSLANRGENGRRRRVGIIGAGDAGAVLAHELSLKPGYGLEPVAFFDDDQGKWHSRVHDIPVMGPPEKLLEGNGKLNIQEVIIAMPSAPARRIGEIVQLLRKSRMPCRTVPSVDQLALGQVRVSQLRNVEVQDLLGRDRVELEAENIRASLQDRVVVVTGAGGSIGSELCRQIATCQPRRLILLERSEPALFLIEQELIGLGHGTRIVPVIGDILDQSRLKGIFSAARPDVVFHAAAHKHVPMMEHQPGEAVKNNSMGTAQLADIASEFGVDRFILISTDKAINPTSVMGTTKRLAEMYVQALNAAHPGRTKFMAVRFGNVLGSSGSVIPLFSKQIAEGGPVKVTHPEMTRFFMTIPEASMLVLQSATQGCGGEIFVLDMGKPVKIVDLARQMIELSGLRPEEDIKIEFVGIRPGEKLFEEITRTGENYTPTKHSKIFRFVSQPRELAELQATLDRLRALIDQDEPNEIKRLLHEAVSEYTPCLTPREKHLTAIAGSMRRRRPESVPVMMSARSSSAKSVRH
ncbi:MAG TPA: nucleoside-diphosphate sugar epimerase/dehydratase [Candidatus Paceibacterota bacterium]|nr:nucleoside-diphosphate sugar epimerase/dehydratase [Candidatus Paceibacterota bacterium]